MAILLRERPVGGGVRTATFDRLYQSRHKGRPVLGARYAGDRAGSRLFDYADDFDRIYKGGGCYAELGMAIWYRMREASASGTVRPDAWRISIHLDVEAADDYGHGSLMFRDAVIDDFGNLVIVPEVRQ